MMRLAALLTTIALLAALSCVPVMAQDAPAAPAGPDASAAPEAPTTPSAPAIDVVAFLKPYADAPQASHDALKKAADLIALGKWKSAFESLDDFDKANVDPFALAMKTTLMLQGAIRTDMHRSFGLVDLEAGQDLESLRNSEGTYEPIAFDPSALADAQAAAGVAAPGILSKVLGDYFYDVLGRFSGQWALSDDDIMAKVVDNYSKAYDAGVYDGASLLKYAESLVKSNRGDESDAVYRKAIRLDMKNANIRYSYAMGLTYRGKKAESLVETDKAIEYYGEAPEKINAIALGARTAAELGDGDKTQAYYAIADKDYPGSPTPGLLRHMVSIESGDDAAAESAAEGLVAAFGSNPSVIRGLISSWYSAGQVEAARDFLVKSIVTGGDDMTVGNLNFYLAVLISQNPPTDEDKETALKALDEAEAHFKTALGPDSEVFSVIAQVRESLQPQAPDASASGEAGAPAPDGASPDAAAPDAPTPDSAGN